MAWWSYTTVNACIQPSFPGNSPIQHRPRNPLLICLWTKWNLSGWYATRLCSSWMTRITYLKCHFVLISGRSNITTRHGRFWKNCQYRNRNISNQNLFLISKSVFTESVFEICNFDFKSIISKFYKSIWNRFLHYKLIWKRDYGTLIHQQCPKQIDLKPIQYWK